MTITKKAARQEMLTAIVDINYSDLVSGVAADAIELPVDAIVVGGSLSAITAFNSATSDVMVVTAPNSDAMLASTSIHTAGFVGAMAVTGKVMGTKGNVTVTWTGVSTAPSAGVCRLIVNYVRQNRTSTNQG